MNDARRKEIQRAQTLIGEAKGILERATTQEQDDLDNMPEAIAARRYRRAASTSAAIARNGWMKSRALRSGTETAKSIKPPTKVSNAATVNNTRRNQTPDAAETAVLAAVGVKPEEFSDTLASCDSSTGHRNPVWFSARPLRRSACGWTISEIILWGQRPLIEQLDKASC